MLQIFKDLIQNPNTQTSPQTLKRLSLIRATVKTQWKRSCQQLERRRNINKKLISFRMKLKLPSNSDKLHQSPTSRTWWIFTVTAALYQLFTALSFILIQTNTTNVRYVWKNTKRIRRRKKNRLQKVWAWRCSFSIKVYECEIW